jgi:Tfp pilus assembly protein PilV
MPWSESPPERRIEAQKVSRTLKLAAPRAEIQMDERTVLVMIHTFFSQLKPFRLARRLQPSRFAATARAKAPHLPLGSEAGISLIEVLISSVIVALISLATFTGLTDTNKATADERAHAQADVVAQQDEDRMRGLQISELSNLKETHTVTYSGTIYTVVSKAEFVSDEGGTSSCTSSKQSADYVTTSSEVKWSTLGTRKPVVETSIITPTIGGALVAQVKDADNEPIAGTTIQAVGPAGAPVSRSATTESNGCAVFGSLTAGEYELTASKTGFVTRNGEALEKTSTSVVVNATAKVEFALGLASKLETSFTSTNKKTAVSGQYVVAFNNGLLLANPRILPSTPAIAPTKLTAPYVKTVASSTIFPLTFPVGSYPAPNTKESYFVYAGTCTADNPTTLSAANPPPKEVPMTPGTSYPLISVEEPPIAVKVYEGTKLVPKKSYSSFQGTLEDTGCKTVQSIEGKTGELPNPAQPYGSYSLCVAAANRYKIIPFKNEKQAGVSVNVYLGEAATVGEFCP